MAVSISIASMHFIVMILFLSFYNVSLRFSRASFFGGNVVTWHSKYTLCRIYTGDFFATRFDDFLCVKISLAKRLLTRGKTRLPQSRLARIAAV